MNELRWWLNVKVNDSYYTSKKTIRDIIEVKKEGKNNIYNFFKPVIPVIKNKG